MKNGDDFLAISEAVNILAQGMRGGLRRPVRVAELKTSSPRLSVIFSEWKIEPGMLVRQACIDRALTVYVVCGFRHAQDQCLQSIDAIALPLVVVERLIATRGGLPDYAIRPNLRTAAGDEGRFRRLLAGRLCVRKVDFDRWYRIQKAKGRWRSQYLKKKKTGGRPTKRTLQLENSILAILADGRWTARSGIPSLRRLLLADGLGIPSEDTLGRLIDAMHRDTGDPQLLRRRRKKRHAAGRWARSPKGGVVSR